MKNQLLVRCAPAMSAALVACLLSIAPATAQTTYDALADFSLNSNPNGPWSYLYNNVLMSATQTNPFPGIEDWNGAVVDGYGEDVGKVIITTPVTLPFEGGQDSFVFPTDYLFLTTALGDITVRFVFPSSGTYAVSGSFLAVEAAQISHSVTILLNGAPMVSGTIATFNQSFPFSFSQTFKTGDVIDFVNDGPVSFSFGYAVGLAVTISPAAALPAISSGGIISAGAFGAFASVAPGSWIEIYGSNLASDSRSWQESDFTGSQAPTSLDGTSVTIGGQDAFIDYISPGQVNALIPSNVSTGIQQIILTAGGVASAPVTITVNTVQPGLLAPPSFNINGTQYVVAIFADGTYVLPAGAVSGVSSHPAKPGDEIVLYGVGFGPVTPGIPAGQLVGEANSLADFHISIGGMPCQVEYDGLAPNYTGLYQFNITVPNVAAGNQPLTFTVNGTAGTQVLDIAVGN